MLAQEVNKKVRSLFPSQETTDMALFVRTSDEDMAGWDREKIVQALVRETYVDEGTAQEIALEVEEMIKRSKITVITAPLIRELVDAKLIERGLEKARRMHTRLGVPLYDVDQMILRPNKENANVPHGPEATNLTLAESIKKEYALLTVFSQEIGDAHMKGDIHLHDLGFIDRPYCSGQSLEYIKKFGLSLPNSLAMAKPAKHAEVLAGPHGQIRRGPAEQFCRSHRVGRGEYLFRPLSGRAQRPPDSSNWRKCSSSNFPSRRWRAADRPFSPTSICIGKSPSISKTCRPSARAATYTGKTYSDYTDLSQKFVWMLFDVYKEGDGSGRPFFFPKPLVHITEKFFQTPGHMDFLHHICDVAAEKGNTYFVFDRGETAKISECCRLSFKLEQSDLDDANEPWKMRYSAPCRTSPSTCRASPTRPRATTPSCSRS